MSVNSSEFTNAIAESINAKREIVGGANNADFTEVHAFLWPSPTSPGIDLNTLIPADSGWTLADPYDINNRGEIIGRGGFQRHKSRLSADSHTVTGLLTGTAQPRMSLCVMAGRDFQVPAGALGR